MNWRKALFVSISILIFSLSIYACGGGFLEFPDEGNVGTKWNLSLSENGQSVRETQLILKQEKRFAPFTGTTDDGATVTGSLNGDNIFMTLENSDGSTTTLTGKAKNEWNTFSGTYESTGSDGSGTWIANRKAQAKALAVSPTSATLSCSIGESQIFTVTGGTVANYKVTASNNLVTLDTSTLTTDGQFTVTAAACSAVSGSTVTLTVTDTSSAATVTATVTIANP